MRWRPFGTPLDSKTKNNCRYWLGSGGGHRRGNHQVVNLPRELNSLAVVAKALGRGALVSVIYMVALAYSAGYRRFSELLLRNDKRGSRARHLLDAAPATNPTKSYPNAR